jgi:transcriptional regulator with PAS, ATPase and Fis domain
MAEAMPADYKWPGNFRELEQAVRNIVITGEYHPAEGRSKMNDINEYYEGCAFKMNQWVSLYAQQAYQRFGSYLEAGNRLGVDQRTLKKWVQEGKGLNLPNF